MRFIFRLKIRKHAKKKEEENKINLQILNARRKDLSASHAKTPDEKVEDKFKYECTSRCVLTYLISKSTFNNVH